MSARKIPAAALIEILEVTDSPDPLVIVPNDIRINGVSILAPDEPIVVHEIATESRDAVRVTLTLYARRVVIGAITDDADS
jgi:hypothetical protein